jgi:DNA-binding Xre family transcriptional regulator
LLKNNLKALAIQRGYNSVRDFAVSNDLNYVTIINFSKNRPKTIDKTLLVKICSLLDCKVGELLEIEN